MKLLEDADSANAVLTLRSMLWEGFEDRGAARECLLKIIKIEPDKNTVFYRWALNLYGGIQKNRYFKEDDKMENTAG